MTRHSKCSAAKKEFVQTIASLIDKSGKSQIEIARALGYENANMITMFKKGTTRIPPEQVVPFAYVIEQDPGLLLRDWFVAHMPDVLPDIERYWPRWT